MERARRHPNPNAHRSTELVGRKPVGDSSTSGAAGGLMRLQGVVGNRAVARMLTPTVQRLTGNRAVVASLQREATRDELLTAYREAVKRKDWGTVAIRLNGFSEGDIITLSNELSHSERVNVAVAARIYMAGWPDYIVPIMKKVDAAVDAGGDVKTLPNEVPALRQRRLALEGGQGTGHVQTADGTAAISDADRVKELVAVRHRLMEIVARLHDRIPANASVDDATEAEVGAQEAVVLAELRNAKTKPEFDHPDRTIQDKVLAALQLQVKRAARESVGEAGARAKWGIDPGDWCGEFAYKKATSVGLDPTAKSGAVSFHQHVDQLERIFTYQDEPTWIWDEASSEWKSLREFHDSRGALRKYWILPAPGGSAQLIDPIKASTDPKAAPYKTWFVDHHLEEYYDVRGAFTPRPGDIVLKDNHGNVRPDHITTAITSGTDHLRTVGGNEGGTSGVKESTSDYNLGANPAPNVPTSGVTKAERIYAIGRWSIIDFETHIYKHGAKPKDAPGSTSPKK